MTIDKLVLLECIYTPTKFSVYARGSERIK